MHTLTPASPTQGHCPSVVVTNVAESHQELGGTFKTPSGENYLISNQLTTGSPEHRSVLVKSLFRFLSPGSILLSSLRFPGSGLLASFPDPPADLLSWLLCVCYKPVFPLSPSSVIEWIQPWVNSILKQSICCVLFLCVSPVTNINVAYHIS